MTKVQVSYIFILIFAAFTMGCDKQVSDYVDGVKRNFPRDTAGNEPMSFKITSGRLLSTTTGGAAIEGTVSPTNQTLQLGPDMSMSVTIGRARMQQQ